MKRVTFFTVLLLVLCVAITGNIYSQIQTSAEEITQNPGRFQNELVSISGMVDHYSPSTANTSAYFVIKGDYAAPLRIHTTNTAPDIGKRYCVTGIVYVNTFNEPFISEASRVEGKCKNYAELTISENPISFGRVKKNNSVKKEVTLRNTGGLQLDIAKITVSNNINTVFGVVLNKFTLDPDESQTLLITFTPTENETYTGIISIVHNGQGDSSNITVSGQGGITIWDYLKEHPLAFILVLCGIAFIILLIIFVSKQMKVKGAWEPEYGTMPNKFETIKIQRPSSPKTLKFIPGQLEIITGPDQGKFFKISGYPTPDGDVVTIGRDPGEGDRIYCHIQLKDQTVSHNQAELIYRNGKLFIKNKSNTNYTIADGRELHPDEMTEIFSGSIIRTGAIEFLYKN